jgi:hypothetical protein
MLQAVSGGGGGRVTESANIAARLAKLEALFARGATEGERAAAGAAIERLRARLAEAARTAREPEIEVQYSLPDVWSLKLFLALCRKAGVRPYRYPRQRRTTVVVRVQRSVFERTVMAEFDALHDELTAAFADLVDHLIADVMHGDADEADLNPTRIAQR